MSLLAALYILLALDVVTTIAGIRKGVREANFVMRWLMDRMGAVPALLVTHVGIGAAAWYWPPGDVVMYVLLAAFAAIGINNLRTLRRL